MNKSVAIILSVIFLLLVIDTYFEPFIPHARPKARKAACLSNLKQLYKGFMMYMQDYDSKIPPSSSWTTKLTPYIDNKCILVCPEERKLKCGYSLNNMLYRRNIKKIARPYDTPLLFDSAGGWNSVDSIDQAIARHSDGYNCVYIDGCVKWIEK